MTSLLIVDADPILRECLARAMRSRGITVQLTDRCELALERVRALAPEWVLIDAHVAGQSARTLVDQFRAVVPSIKVILWRLHHSPRSAASAVHYLQRPADADDIVLAFERLNSATANPVPDPPRERRASML